MCCRSGRRPTAWARSPRARARSATCSRSSPVSRSAWARWCTPSGTAGGARAAGPRKPLPAHPVRARRHPWSPMRRGSPAPGRSFVLATGALALFSVARTFGLLGPPVASIGLLVGVLALIAWFGGATLEDLGLGWADTREGLLY